MKTDSLTEQQISDLVDAFLARFPLDTSSWARATDELPDMLRWLNEQGADVRVNRADVDHSPSVWNAGYRKAIKEAFGKLTAQGRAAFYMRFGSWLDPEVEDDEG